MNTLKKSIAGGALVFATLGGGALGATLVNGAAGAQTNPTTSTTAATTSTENNQAADHDGDKGAHEANGITETALTGTDLSKAEAAALKAVPGGTVERAETDAEGAKYEVHMTKSDGSDVTVKLDASFKVTETLDGHG